MTDFSKMTDKELREHLREWSEDMFSATKKGATINSILTYTPLIQVCSNELTVRFIRRSTRALILISILALAVSASALWVTYTTLQLRSEQTREIKKISLFGGDKGSVYVRY